MLSVRTVIRTFLWGYLARGSSCLRTQGSPVVGGERVQRRVGGLARAGTLVLSRWFPWCAAVTHICYYGSAAALKMSCIILHCSEILIVDHR